jgi:hypothetical protein
MPTVETILVNIAHFRASHLQIQKRQWHILRQLKPGSGAEVWASLLKHIGEQRSHFSPNLAGSP